MKKKRGLHLLYKNLGETPLECIERFKLLNPEFKEESMTYAGRLDPMAEGLLLVLSGEEIKNKEVYLNLPKTYLCRILWGFSTDSLDILGLVTGKSDIVPEKELVGKEIGNFIGTFDQKYPVYSSKLIAERFRGNPGVNSETHQVKMTSAEFIARENVPGKELFEIIKERVLSVTGDFRQKETIVEWQKVILPSNQYVVDTIRLGVSSGFYVRQFVSDLSSRLGALAVTFHIKREKVGEFRISATDSMLSENG